MLGQIFDPPLVLYALGDTAILSKPAIAVVGSRRCSVFGSEVAYTLGRDLVRRGLVVVSGMALGIDGKAHQGALSGSGETVAVLGTGVDVVYPRSHRKLYQQIRETGCVVSECPLGAFPAPQNFPIRNRIISGLSVGTVIPEASEFSGSLITARLTLEQDRELWAVPGNITNPGSYGPNHLIKQGARPLLDVQDVLEGLPVHILNALERKLDEETDRQQPDPVEEEILRMLLVEEAEPFDRLLVRSGRNITDLSGILVSLEAKGLVRSLPGRRYCRRLVTVSSTKEERAPIRN
ncbi:MAG: DNA-processing protein DprA [Acidobacteriota bacterium]